MKKGFALPLLLLLIVGISIGFILWKSIGKKSTSDVINTNIPEIPLQVTNPSQPGVTVEDIPQVSVVATGLDTPWAIAILPEGGLLVTERKGMIRLVDSSGGLQENPVAQISSAKEIGEGGLQGIVLHPDFISNKYVYLYYTYAGSSDNTLNRVVRMTHENKKLTDEKIIVDAIPGASNHDWGRIKFGPDRMLYITTGDAQNPSLAQDTNSLAGKILRVTDEGKPAPGNPFENRVYTFGHRNPQGIAWDSDGTLWATEHGPSGLETGNDEFNRIESGKNYGWPEIRGSQTKSGMMSPILESGRGNTWAPSGLAYVGGKFFFAGLRGQALYEVSVNGSSASLKTHFKSEFGRLREVLTGPDGMLYITTSNRDGRGNPKTDDDKIIRINPQKL